MRITIKGLLFVISMFAVLFATLSVLRNAPDYSSQFTLAGNLFTFATFVFLFHSSISILYRNEEQRAFWIGCTLACASLMFIEPRFERGMEGLCRNVAEHIVVTSGNDYTRNAFKWDNVGIVIRSCAIIFLSLGSGLLTDSMDRRKASQRTPNETPGKTT